MNLASHTLRSVSALLIAVPMALAQSPDIIRDKVQQIGISNKITIVLKTGHENYGAVADIGSDSFQIVEVDQRLKMTIRYDEVKKVRANYGGKGFAGKRPNPLWGVIAGVALVGILVAIGAAASGS